MQPIRLRGAAFLSASLFLTALASSQVNPFVFYPQDPERQTLTCTSFVGRPDWNNAAEALVELNIDNFRGIGDANGLVRLFGIYHWVADERLSTTETYDLVVRNGLPAGGPDMSQAAEFLRIPGLTTPPSTNPLRGTWIMYDGFNLSGGLSLVSYTQPPYSPPRYYVGVDLPANPLWPATDGHSLFRADMLNANTGATVGENHHAGAPNPTWAGLHAGQSFSTPWTYVLGPFVTSPNLHMGGIDPTSNRLGAPGANIGMGGMFPDVGGQPRSDGLIARVTDNLAPYGWAFLGAQLGFRPAYFEFSYMNVLIGHSHIGDLSVPPLALGLAILQNGVREFTIAPPGTIPPALVGTHLAFQAIVFDANTNIAEWTDAQAVHF
ncbi:MAG: hypothetical protein U1E73_04130 [Planctomycetota bacterium]